MKVRVKVGSRSIKASPSYKNTEDFILVSVHNTNIAQLKDLTKSRNDFKSVTKCPAFYQKMCLS